MRIQRSQPKFWSAHTHSRYSNNDALPSVTDIVERAYELGQPAVGLTDHGNMIGSVELYQACMKRGMKPFPGSELYFVPDIEQHKRDYTNKSVKASRYHMGVLAYTTEGYENLVNLSTTSHLQHFHKPLVDFATLAALHDAGRTSGLAVTTGCYFGYLVQTLTHQGEEAAERFLYTLGEWFPESVYVEIQNHNIDHGDGWCDDSVADALVAMADRLGLPVIITQDSHYLLEGDRADHESLKRLVAWGDAPDDAVFPGDGFHVADTDWIRDRHHQDRYERGLRGLDHLLRRHELRIPVLDSYAYSIPRVVDRPQDAMVGRCLLRADELSLSKRYRDQLAEEIEVIGAADMAGYMMLVAMVTDYMRENGIVFQTRGSAAGSLVCWLLGITNVDPIKWDLRFERFLSRDRTKPPDIDLDIAHDRRQELIDWLNSKFAVHQIGSHATYSMEHDDDEDEDKGSLLRRYFSSARKRGIEDFESIPEEDREMLFRLSELELFSNFGKNAAGVVITSTKEEFDRLVPLHYMSSGTPVSQYGKDDIEALGLVKLDVLGSKTLTVLRRTMDNLGLEVSNLADIELTDRPTLRLMQSGDTAGIFQLEGGSSKWGCKKLKPTHINDVIAAMALFRPATMNSGGTDAFIKRKHGREEVPARHSLLMRTTQTTYGVILYQEQVIDILRALGMDPENLTKFLKAVKTSNKGVAEAAKVIASYREWLGNKYDEIGMTQEDKEFVDEAIAGFAEYGFNRAHATVYGITAYRCAYLAVHHGLEFHAALLAVAAGSRDKKNDKEGKYLKAARDRGIRVLKADINSSGATYGVDRGRGAIRKGLRAVKGIGDTTAAVLAEHQPYRSVEDLVRRAPARPVSGGKSFNPDKPDLNDLCGVLEKLALAGALDSLPLTDKEVRSSV